MTRVNPDAYLCDSITINSDGKHETKSAHVEKKDYDSEEPLYTKETIKRIIEQKHGELLEKLEHLNEDEETGMTTLTQELIEEVESE